MNQYNFKDRLGIKYYVPKYQSMVKDGQVCYLENGKPLKRNGELLTKIGDIYLTGVKTDTVSK